MRKCMMHGVTVFFLTCGPELQSYRTFTPPITHLSRGAGFLQISLLFLFKYVVVVPYLASGMLGVVSTDRANDANPGATRAGVLNGGYHSPVLLSSFKYSVFVYYLG